ncbi:NAD-dependent epimerase/dehydratase family protein [Gluconobacter sphaericus]|uniref:NAD dependent epimerase/dehydratase n=1 Tax=Gluconobacter sphaericus NBRC 12467 TaxID=1307951 RepID=A0AA37WAX5_9PROT|nr:NAD(P)-dependent oxidoreductase [Gluconobacter sphaericus]MBF0886048.1 NAD(P)-dependent oxidoreductase [Gluconobacter sphaericus]MBS1087024.1 NAD(P)-dependent oxidoreductase [Gluconobacter sphaericus]MBS1097949.1 NAD(P)-dependent oxidoreductase [Gluconobacter sphaericus]MBS1100954.1 NAD(P)-dependent oxidoreductase [Gluconobacter sphaericus]GBR52185.1 NAD-dependent epimerase/dehydratase [Gluconobacter sphaericus NBRC 12467]
MKILITGGTGFVGLALAEALLKLGHVPVLFAMTPVAPWFGSRAPFRDVKFIEGNVCSASDVGAAVEACAPEIVIHLAAMTPDLATEKASPARITEINVSGVANLLCVLQNACNVRRVVIASSVAIYGPVDPAEGPIEETRLLAPQSLYGITKLAAEKMALRLGDIYGMDIRLARIGPVYGPWEHDTGVRPLLSPQAQVLSLLKAGKKAVLGREMWGDWLYSRDAGAALAAIALSTRLRHAIYNVGNGHVSAVATWGTVMAEALHAPGISLAGGGDDANVHFPMKQDRAPLSIARLRQDTDFIPSFTDTLNDYLTWLEHYPNDF